MGLAYSLRFHHRVFKRFLSANIPPSIALQAVALGLCSKFFSSLCSHRFDLQAGFRGKAVSSNGSVSGDVDVR
jgi:hypothetical protein